MYVYYGTHKHYQSNSLLTTPVNHTQYQVVALLHMLIAHVHVHVHVYHNEYACLKFYMTLYMQA